MSEYGKPVKPYNSTFGIVLQIGPNNRLWLPPVKEIFALCAPNRARTMQRQHLLVTQVRHELTIPVACPHQVGLVAGGHQHGFGVQAPVDAVRTDGDIGPGRLSPSAA